MLCDFAELNSVIVDIVFSASKTNRLKILQDDASSES